MKINKRLLLIYLVVSAFTFTYLVLPEKSGISVPLFGIIQCIFLWYLIPDKRRLWLYVPIFILCMNSFISGNGMWRFPNLIVGIILFSLMMSEFNGRLLTNVLENTIVPIGYFDVPLRWISKSRDDKSAIVRRVVIAVVITVPILIMMLLLLSSADMIFGKGIENLLNDFISPIRFQTIWRTVFGVGAGFYLFGAVYNSYVQKKPAVRESKEKSGDVLILGIILISVLIVYTIFAVIQFRYLFAGSALPYGLTYTEYARKGFFELLFLTTVNIFLILLVVSIAGIKHGKFTKFLSSYLCLMTVVLLFSSFYRMWLYNSSDGLTRLRFLVFGFLIFEFIGLLITFFYIQKPKFNIVAVYFGIGLVYYLLLNIVPMDYFVAKSQVDMYLKGEREGIEYALTLSSDAASQIKRLPDSQSVLFFAKQDSIPTNWQSYNLSRSQCNK